MYLVEHFKIDWQLLWLWFWLWFWLGMVVFSSRADDRTHRA
jgi:hypothetical protein